MKTQNKPAEPVTQMISNLAFAAPVGVRPVGSAQVDVLLYDYNGQLLAVVPEELQLREAIVLEAQPDSREPEIPDNGLDFDIGE